MADTIIRTVKATREVGVVSAGDQIHVELKTQEVNNSSEIQLQDNVINGEPIWPQSSAIMSSKICSKCAKRSHFAKISRSTNVDCLGNQQDEQQEEVETEGLETKNDPVPFAEFTLNNGWDKYQIDKFSVMAIAEAVEIKNTNILSEDDLSGHTHKLKTNSEEFFAIANSRSSMSFLNKNTARHIQQKR